MQAKKDYKKLKIKMAYIKTHNMKFILMMKDDIILNQENQKVGCKEEGLIL